MHRIKSCHATLSKKEKESCHAQHNTLVSILFKILVYSVSNLFKQFIVFYKYSKASYLLIQSLLILFIFLIYKYSTRTLETVKLFGF